MTSHRCPSRKYLRKLGYRAARRVCRGHAHTPPFLLSATSPTRAEIEGRYVQTFEDAARLVRQARHAAARPGGSRGALRALRLRLARLRPAITDALAAAENPATLRPVLPTDATAPHPLAPRQLRAIPAPFTAVPRTLPFTPEEFATAVEQLFAHDQIKDVRWEDPGRCVGGGPKIAFTVPRVVCGSDGLIGGVPPGDIIGAPPSPAASAPQQLHLGDMRVVLRVADLGRGNPVESVKLNDLDLASRHGYPHPHVSCEGRPCFGEAGDNLDNASRHLDLVAVVDLVIAFLATYNPDSPYCEIERWDELGDGDDDEMCEDCGNRVPTDEGGWIDGELLCADCCTSCEHCGDRVRREDMYYSEYSGQGLCESCCVWNPLIDEYFTEAAIEGGISRLTDADGDELTLPADFDFRRPHGLALVERLPYHPPVGGRELVRVCADAQDCRDDDHVQFVTADELASLQRDELAYYHLVEDPDDYEEDDTDTDTDTDTDPGTAEAGLTNAPTTETTHA